VTGGPFEPGHYHRGSYAADDWPERVRLREVDRGYFTPADDGQAPTQEERARRRKLGLTSRPCLVCDRSTELRGISIPVGLGGHPKNPACRASCFICVRCGGHDGSGWTHHLACRGPYLELARVAFQLGGYDAVDVTRQAFWDRRGGYDVAPRHG
jgi:hypothetical protein